MLNPFRRVVLALVPLATAGTLIFSPPTLAATLGEAKVLSMQGQKLKIALPFSAGPQETVAPLRFSVKSLESPDGVKLPAPTEFAVMQPGNGGMVYLQSLVPIDATRLSVTIELAADRTGNPTQQATYNLVIPALAYASSQGEPVAAKAGQSLKMAKRNKRRSTALAKAPAKAPLAQAVSAKDALLMKTGGKAGCGC